MALDDHIRAILSGAPHLLETPALATGLAVGAAQQMDPNDARAIAQATHVGLFAKALQELQEEAGS